MIKVYGHLEGEDEYQIFYVLPFTGIPRYKGKVICDHTIMEEILDITELQDSLSKLRKTIEKINEKYDIPKCKWTLADDDFGIYNTSCQDECYIVDNGTPKENNMKFCPFCGKQIEE